MSKITLITTKMMKNLEYDGEINEEIEETNDLKINSKLHNWTFEIPKNEKIKLTEDHMNDLSMIESNENCIPLHIAKKNIVLGLKFCEEVSLKAVNSYLEIENQIIRIRAKNEIPLYAVIRDIVLSSLLPINQINVLFDDPRQQLIQYIIRNLFQGKILNECSVENYNVKKFYSSMFVFEPSDFDAAANHLVETFNDPNIPWKISYIYVQESCKEKFHEKIVDKLKPFAKEILRDKSFVRDYKNVMEILIKLQAQQLGKTSSTKYFPLICHEFDRNYFDKTSIFSPVIFKTVRTVEEAIKLARHGGSNSASIWCMNHSLAYEIVNKLDYSMFWINCLGIIDSSLPIRISDLSKTNADKFLKVFEKNGVYIKNSYHFEYFICSQGSTKEYYKNIIFPIGLGVQHLST